MRAAVVTFPASNCERDLTVALRAITGREPLSVWHTETELPPLDLIALPGGFAYGDYLRCGAIAARSPVMREVSKRARQGVLVLGVCNGFQVLTEAGLLPGAVVRNQGLKFVCRTVRLRVETAASPFTRSYPQGAEISVPVAHAEGCYVADDDTLQRLEGEDRVVLRYLDNPNGSQRDVAGILNERRNVFGLMPHPERACEKLLGGTDGRALFASMLASVAA